MFTTLLHARAAWTDHFTGSPNTILSNEYRKGQTPSGTGVYVLNCLFRSITSESNGGALSCSSVEYLLVESSSFFSCRTNNYIGGAIYITNSGGQCVLYEVCGFDCCSAYTSGSSYGQFSRIDLNDIAQNKIYVNYSSIVRCMNVNSNSYNTFNHNYGNNFYPSVNFSMNKCYYGSGIYCHPRLDSSSVTCSISYSSFVDNIATGETCIRLWRANTKHEIKNCNIIRNTQVSSTCGTIYTNTNVMIEDSCILENEATCIFYQESSSYKITLSNCTVDSTSNNGYLTTQNAVTKSFVLVLNHMSTKNCHSEYDSAGTLVSSKKQICYCTYGIFFLQPHLIDIISLNNILIFNFIHPYA
jgi:hypothetical protein